MYWKCKELLNFLFIVATAMYTQTIRLFEFIFYLIASGDVFIKAHEQCAIPPFQQPRYTAFQLWESTQINRVSKSLRPTISARTFLRGALFSRRNHLRRQRWSRFSPSPSSSPSETHDDHRGARDNGSTSQQSLLALLHRQKVVVRATLLQHLLHHLHLRVGVAKYCTPQDPIPCESGCRCWRRQCTWQRESRLERLRCRRSRCRGKVRQCFQRLRRLMINGVVHMVDYY